MKIEENPKICPLVSKESVVCRCQERACAWWDEGYHDCAVLSLVVATRAIPDITALLISKSS